MAANTNAVPIILCGQTEAIGRGVVEGLKPEFEVVQFITGAEAAVSEIPTVLQGQAPAAPSSALGSGNLSVRPKAVVLGGAFVETFESIKTEVEKQLEGSGGSQVIWCIHDPTKPHPPIGPEYGKAVLARCKELLGQLRDEGKLHDPKTESHTY